MAQPLPSPEQSLRSYVATWSTSNVDSLFVLLGVSPVLAERVDARLQVIPLDLAERLANWLRRPVGEVIWAAGGKVLAAPSPGADRRAY